MSRRKNTSGRLLGFESLETRDMITIVVQDGILGIRGTKLDDTIAIARAGNQFQLDYNGQRTLINAPNNMRALVIDGWDGNDDIRVADNVGVLTIVVGGKGNDYIKGGYGTNYLYGDAGNDTM